MAVNEDNQSWTPDKWHEQHTWRDWDSIGAQYTTSPGKEALIPEQLKYLENITGKYTNVRFIRPIGEGAFGKVWRVMAKRHFQYVSTGTAGEETVTMACKVIRLVYADGTCLVERVKTIMLSDVLILQGLDYTHITVVDHYIPIPDTSTGFPFAAMLVFMELCDGDLVKVMEKTPGHTLPSYYSRIWFMQMALAVEYLHVHHVVHLDIKPGNILFKFTDRSHKVDHLWDSRFQSKAMHSIVYKLSDFGVAIKYAPEAEMVYNQARGSQRFMAPELRALQGVPPEQARPVRTVPCDIYSLGMTLANTHVGDDRFNANCYKMMKFMKNKNIVESEPLLSQLVQAMVAPVPRDRPGIQQVMQHQWLWNPY